VGMRLRRQDPVAPGTPVAPAAQPARGSSILRTLRTAWWPRLLIAGLVLVIVGVTLLSGAAQGKSWDQDRRREPPVPPGSGRRSASDRSWPFNPVNPGRRQPEARVASPEPAVGGYWTPGTCQARL
jgi:hypothetical protein